MDKNQIFLLCSLVRGTGNKVNGAIMLFKNQQYLKIFDMYIVLSPIQDAVCFSWKFRFKKWVSLLFEERELEQELEYAHFNYQRVTCFLTNAIKSHFRKLTEPNHMSRIKVVLWSFLVNKQKLCLYSVSLIRTHCVNP